MTFHCNFVSYTVLVKLVRLWSLSVVEGAPTN